ncbi:MAG: ribonuclease HII [archaeon]
MLIAGVDEAGRGPALGPMVLSIASIEKKDEEKLVKLGVKDSKLLTEKERERQNKELPKILFEFNSVHIGPAEIDQLRDRKSLNEIEAMRIGYLLNSLKRKPDIAYIDSPDPIAKNFGKRIEKYISFSLEIRAEHKADLNYPIVGAASIIAKVERDAAIKRLCRQHGNMGSGYPHDPDTISFLCNWVKKNKSLPDFARKSWETSKNIENKVFQKKLDQYK